MTSLPERPANAPATQWQTRVVGDLSELAQARVETINIVQWLARIANSYVVARTSERRSALEFKLYDAAIVTGEFDKAIALEMRLPTLELQFRENGKPVPHVFDPEEHSPAELEAWLLVELLHRGVDREKFSKQLPYNIAGLMSGDAEDYSPRLCRPGLISLTALMRDATAILNAAASGERGDAASIACLPQSLNLVAASDSSAESCGFAFSPGDAGNPEPYYYLGGGSGRDADKVTIKASVLMTESDPMTAALKLKTLAAH
jgi:hypothetical protein